MWNIKIYGITKGKNYTFEYITKRMIKLQKGKHVTLWRMKRLQKNDDCLKGIMQATKRNGDVTRRMFTTPIGVF